MVYVISQEGKPLDPTARHRKVRLWLKNKQAVVVRRKPFTIQLCFDTTDYTKEYTLGEDAGYQHIGVSVVSPTEEVLRMQVNLLEGMVERNQERSMYRRNRRNRLRYRKPRFNNRKKDKGWLAPSIEHKLDSHQRITELVKSILPIKRTVIEVAAFDTQKLFNPDIEGLQYQQGVQADFFNLREYILHRDGHKCQNPNCKNKDKQPILVLHHIIFRSNGGSDSPNNLITLCTKCHTPRNHKGFLKTWKPKIPSMKPSTFMSMVRWRLVNALQCDHTYGYITKSTRIEHGIEKSHSNDAFVIAGGTTQERAEEIQVKQIRRNNRCLQTFKDAKYIDIRTGEKVNASELNSGRTTRNKDKNGENLRIYRGKKVKAGFFSIRKQRYPFQPSDLVRLPDGTLTYVVGSQNKGAYVKCKDVKKVQKPSDLKMVKSGKGFCFQ